MKLNQLEKFAIGIPSALLICASAWSQSITLSDSYHFRQQFSANSSFGRSDLTDLGVTVKSAGTSVTASQGSITKSLPLVSPDNAEILFPYDSSLTGTWTITAVNGGNTNSIQTNDIVGVEPMPFVENLSISGVLLTPTVSWSLPNTSVPHNRVRIRIYEQDNEIYRSPSLGLVNSFNVPDSLLTQGKFYVIRVMLEDTTSGYLVNRSSDYIGYNLSVTPQANLESPQQGSFESGIGLIRGWVCQANSVQIQINDGPRRRVAYGTTRGDTLEVCGDDNNGFGYTFNWNALGTGIHRLRAFADGVEFANVSFNVTTLGVDFLRGASGEYTLPNFPQPGRSVTARWAEPHQNFVIAAASQSPASVSSNAAVPLAASLAYLESPQQDSFESGIGLIRGWVCQAQSVEIQINDEPRRTVAYGTTRGDTLEVCGDDNNGFGYTFNWNALGTGTHRLRTFADGAEFANVTFNVTTLGEDYLQGASGEYTLPNFPQAGQSVTLRWAEPHQNFVIINYEPITGSR